MEGLLNKFDRETESVKQWVENFEEAAKIYKWKDIRVRNIHTGKDCYICNMYGVAQLAVQSVVHEAKMIV